MARAALFLVLLLAILSCFTIRAAEITDPDLKAKVEDAEEAQQFGEDPIQPVEAQIVEEAPKAIVANGDGDVATTGECRADVTNFCPTIKPGENRLAECLSNQLDMELKGNAEGKKLSAKCKEELAAFKIDEGTNINKNLPLAASCEADATKLCADSDPNDPGAVLACLREYKPDLSEACSDEIFKTEQEGAKDFRVDADLHAACQADADLVCKDVEPGEGRVQDCLRAKHGEVSWECQEELFRQEVENADDIRLSIRLINACMADKKTFCSDVKPGNARVKDCLEEHREDPKFTQECRTEFEKMMGRRATDFRLDSSLREQCAEDIEVVCGYEKDSMDAIEGFDARVIQCLQDFKDELHDEQCKGQVHKLTERAAQDIRFDEPLAEACFDDRQKLCSGVQPGSSRVIACLQDRRDELSFECKATLFDQEVKMAEDIDFKYPMKKNCGAEIDKFCPTVQHGNGRIIRCLQDHLDDEDMSQECKAEVEQDQVRSNQDFRLNFRLSKACKKDIAALCIHECSTYLGQACGGKVLRCLTEKQEEIEDTDCKKEVFQFEKMEVSDMRNDAPMALACKADLETYCKGVKPGEGRLLKCLRDHKEDLSTECAAEDTKLAILQSQDIRLTPRLHQLCSGEVAAYCKDVKPGKARVFQCLQEHLGEPNFGKDCLEQVEARAQRMQEDYRLDYGVSTQCKEDVPQFCAAEQGKLHGHAEVQKCLISHTSELDSGCQREMSRAVRMALWEYKPDMALTSVCDSDVEKICGLGGNGTSQRGLWNIGVVGRCLSRQLAEQKPIGEQCRSLVAVAAPQDAQELFNSSMNEAALTQRFLELQQAAGIKTKLVNPAASGAGAITLTGWVALVAVACIITTVMGGMYFVYKRILGPDPKSQYVVIKSGNV